MSQPRLPPMNAQHDSVAEDVATTVVERLRRVRQRRAGVTIHEAFSPEVRAGADTYRVGAIQEARGSHIGCEIVVIVLERCSTTPEIFGELSLRYRLTRREASVAMLLAGRRSTAEIASALGVSVHTARHHVERVLAKLGVHSRREAASALAEYGLTVSDEYVAPRRSDKLRASAI